jgi:putative ABC transport system permease protein
VPLLLGVRLAARRPRRMALSAAGAAVTVSGLVTALAAHAQLKGHHGIAGLADPKSTRLSHVLLMITLMLVLQAAVNAIFLTWATVVDSTPSAALARALGATPGQVAAGIAAAQVLPATGGAILGVPLGLGLFVAVSGDARTLPSAASLVATLAGTVAALVALTIIPTRTVHRRSVARLLGSERA